MGINLAQLRYLIAVIDTGSMQRAAQQVHVSQPSISRAVRALENELGVTLFARSGRNLVPTDAAADVVAIARRICCDVDRLAVLADESPTVTVAATPSIEALVTDAVINYSRSLRTGTDVKFVTAQSTGEVEELVASASADVGLIENDPTQRLRSQHLCDIELVVVARPEMGLTDPLPIEQLGEIGLVLPTSGSARRLEIDGFLADLGVTPQVAFESDNRTAWMNAAASGHAACFTFTLGPKMATEGLRFYSCDPPMLLSLQVVYVRQPTPAVRAMFDRVAQLGTTPT